MFFAQKHLFFGPPLPPFTDKIRKVVFEVFPYWTGEKKLYDKQSGEDNFERSKELERDSSLHLLEEMILEKTDGIEGRMKSMEEDKKKSKTEMKHSRKLEIAARAGPTRDDDVKTEPPTLPCPFPWPNSGFGDG